ncbi:unnamed protein product [Mytilus coruscus]|uniref:CCHC-type domain-containing protein n=1 Tax=Mytilus coruscus TaxID=42192 RepID=A0A6J8E919_MYTCO|nr:unnamed protein product [Mytilus coruscus]
MPEKYYEHQSAIQNIMIDINSFGEVNIEDKPCDIVLAKKKAKQDHVMVPIIQLKAIENIKLTVNKIINTKENVFRCCILPDVKVISNKGLKGFKVKMPCEPFDTVYISQDNTLAVTSVGSAKHCITIIDLAREKIKKTITVYSHNYGIALKDNRLMYSGYDKVRRNVIFERAKFNKRKQDDDEGVESFVTSLYTLTEHCGYNDLRQEMIKDRIVVGIKDSNLSLKMQLDPELTLKKATDMARQSESVKKQQAIMRCDNPNSNVDAVKSKFNKTKFVKKQKQPFHSQQKAGCQRCGNRQYHPREKCPAKGAKCYKCSNIGHFAKSCKTGKTVESVSVNSDSEGFLGTINTVGDRPWTTKLFIRKKEIDFKIDTGADVTVISDSDLNGINSIELTMTNESEQKT